MADEKSKAQRSNPPASIGKRHSHSLPVIAKSGLATLLLAGAVAAASYALSNGIAQPHDDVSLLNAQARLEAFRALDPLPLSVVTPGDINRALQDMQLSPAALASLKADLSGPSALATQAPAPSAVSQQQPAPAPVAKPEAQAQRLRLVWIYLWDTDAEDGDVVRIDSHGYSRTVRLTKRGDTFAVPMPADGVIRVTGVKDGDGGGITVGFASGGARAVFPVMSEGQVLGLRVRVD
ncbi:hypothetical protein [Dyella sp. Tek66A03]|uniref:hypothetical protein n=1 Tax=Dyella sp. Tek66A03 TaxID=3458298 RepID=UPI00403EA553